MTKSKSTVRELVRVMFESYRLLLLFVLAGAGLYATRGLFEERTYRGWLELASDPQSGPTSGALPDTVLLRRLVLDPELLQILAPSQGDLDEGQVHKRLQELENQLEMKPLFSSTPSEASVWRLTLDVPAQDVEKARAQVLAYVHKLQSKFTAEAGQAETAVAANAPKPSGNAGPVTHTAGYGPTHDSAAASKDQVEQPPAPGLGSALAKERVQLEAQARELDVNLDSLPDAVAQLRQQFNANRDRLAKLDQMAVEKIALVNEIEKGHTKTLPRAMEADYPELAATRKMLDQLLDERLALRAQMTDAHPTIRELDRKIADMKTRFNLELEEVGRLYRAQVQRWDDEGKSLREKQDELDTRLKPLAALLASKQKLDARQAEFTLMQQTYRERLLNHRPSVSTSHTAAKAPPSAVLVAGPFIDPTPTRPRTAWYALVGSLAGLGVGIVLVLVLHGADQRIRRPQDIEELNIGTEVLGTVPKLAAKTPVHWALVR